MLFAQKKIQRAEDKLVGLDIFKSEFPVTEEGSMVIKASRSKSTRLWEEVWAMIQNNAQMLTQCDD